MKKLSRIYIAPLLLTVLCLAAAAGAQQPDDCSLEFEGEARKAVKTRTIDDGRNYTFHNGGRGLRFDRNTGSKVRGLWEIHPVTNVRVVGN